MCKMPLEKSSDGQKGRAEHLMPVLVKLDIPVCVTKLWRCFEGDAQMSIEEVQATEDYRGNSRDEQLRKFKPPAGSDFFTRV